jgi:hypothetical protein
MQVSEEYDHVQMVPCTRRVEKWVKVEQDETFMKKVSECVPECVCV